MTARRLAPRRFRFARVGAKQTPSLDHSEEPSDAPRSSSLPGISDIERLHP
jgi:hypothetical protein